MGPKPPPKRVAPKLSALKMDMDDVQNDIDYLKSKSFILCDMYSFRTLSCNRQRRIKKDSLSIHPKTKPAYDTKPKGQHGRKKGGYNLQDELGLGKNKSKYDALQVR